MRAAVTLSLLAAFAWTGPSLAQVGDDGNLRTPPVNYPAILSQARDAEAFAPPGWKIQARAEGDLNGDGLADLALVLKGLDPREIVPNPMAPNEVDMRVDTNPHILVVALGRKDGGYELAAESNALIPRRLQDNIEDYFDEEGSIRITRGALRVAMQSFANAGSYGVYNVALTFRWRVRGLVLVGYDSQEFSRSTHSSDTTSVNYLTHRIRHGSAPDEDHRERVWWTTLPPAPLLTLADVGDGMEFDPAAQR